MQCPLCHKADRVMTLPGFVASGGSPGVLFSFDLEEIARMQLQDFAEVLEMPLPGRLEGRWRDAHDLWSRAFVCLMSHPVGADQPPRGMVVFYIESGRILIQSPVDFAKKIRQIAGIEE